MVGERWSWSQRITFRFLCIAALLIVFPFPLGYIPGTWGLARLVTAPWDPAVAWFAEAILGIDAPRKMFTGSGDTLWHHVQLLLIVCLAGLGTLAWSLLDRRTHHRRLASALIVLLRYFLAAMMVIYGLAKVFPIQFGGALGLARQDVTLGDMSPMGLLWTFMAASVPYTFVVGVAELVGAVLLLSRRTAVFGALVTAIVMSNVVLLNLCYDVPVKLFSIELLLMAIAVALPHARRLVTAALGRPTTAVPPRPFGSLAFERVRLIAKLVLIASMVAHIGRAVQLSRMIEPSRTALHGMWRVDRHRVDGVDLAPDFTDERRWRLVIVHERGVTVRHATDRRSHLRVEIDPVAQTFTVLDGIVRNTLRYRRDGDRLALDGTMRGQALHLDLVLLPPPLLSTRGFRWVQDEPYYR